MCARNVFADLPRTVLQPKHSGSYRFRVSSVSYAYDLYRLCTPPTLNTYFCDARGMPFPMVPSVSLRFKITFLFLKTSEFERDDCLFHPGSITIPDFGKLLREILKKNCNFILSDRVKIQKTSAFNRERFEKSE